MLWIQPVSAALQVMDDTGRQVELAEPATRIVSLSPHLTELVFAIGAGERLVGVAEYSDFPPPARRLPRIGRSGAVDLEALAQLRPQLVLAWDSGNDARQIARIERLGMAVYRSEPRRLEDIAVNMRRLGRLTGVETQADRAAAEVRSALAGLADGYRDREPVSLFFQVWRQPLITIGGRHIVNDVIELCGGRNIFAGEPSLAPRVALESVMAADPDAIVVAANSAHERAQAARWRRWPQLRAVAADHVLVLPADELYRPTPRLLQGAHKLCRALQGVREDRRQKLPRTPK